MPSVELQIEAILAQRKKSLPLIDDLFKRCTIILTPIEEAKLSLDDLSSQCEDRAVLADICNKASTYLTKCKEKIFTLEQDLNIAQKRFSRNTINVGFAGTKGTGKSYLLQKLSGLTDNEVPSAEGMPVTAVRCVIKNSQENKAYVAFHDEQGFLEERVAPFCREIHINIPSTLQEFASLDLNIKLNSDKEEIYRQKLADYQKNLEQYASLLTGGENEIELKDLRKYVAYTVLEKNNPGHFENSSVYLAVKSVEIHCTFPRTAIRDLLLIDLPGLGELDPALESRHTEGFKDMVDVCLFIRRPAGTRMDWDREAQKALDTLTENCPVDTPSDFILVVINAGGCKPDSAAIMMEETNTKLGGRYTILNTNRSDSNGLSNEVLSKALDHLAEHLPKSDAVINKNLSERMEVILSNLAKFCEDAKRLLRQNGKGRDTEEIIRHTAIAASKHFAKLNQDVLAQLTKNAEKKDMKEIVDELSKIQTKMEEYFKNGMDIGNRQQWNTMNIDTAAKDLTIDKIVLNAKHALRVQMTRVLSKSLDPMYEQYVKEMQQYAVNSLNDPLVLNNLLNQKTPHDNLQLFLNYIDESELPLPQMREAVENLLNLKIEHNVQFYPRVYDEIRKLKRSFSEDDQKKFRIDQINEIYDMIVEIGRKTINEICAKILHEIKEYLNSILIVSFEIFDDVMIRNEEVDEEWIRFFKSYYRQIHGEDESANMSILLNKAVSKIEDLHGYAL